MKSSIVLVAAFLCLVVFPTSTVGKNARFWPEPSKGWPNPKNFNYGHSKYWRCTCSNGTAISISTPSTSYQTPSTPFPPPTPKTSPPPPTPSPPPPTPKTSPPPPTPSPPPPTPKTSPPPPPTPSPPPPTPKTSPPPPPTPKTSPPPPTPSLPPPTPKTSPPPPTPSLPPPTPKKSPSPPASNDQPSNPPPEHHHQNPPSTWEHNLMCYTHIGPVWRCRGEMLNSYRWRTFQVSKYCCDLVVNMAHECADYYWGDLSDRYFVPLVRCTCHETY